MSEVKRYDIEVDGSLTPNNKYGQTCLYSEVETLLKEQNATIDSLKTQLNICQSDLNKHFPNRVKSLEGQLQQKDEEIERYKTLAQNAAKVVTSYRELMGRMASMLTEYKKIVTNGGDVLEEGEEIDQLLTDYKNLEG